MGDKTPYSAVSHIHMVLMSRQQLPSIEYVLSSVSLGYYVPSPAGLTSASPSIYEPCQTALLQWAHGLTASQSPHKTPGTPQQTVPSRDGFTTSATPLLCNPRNQERCLCLPPLSPASQPSIASNVGAFSATATIQRGDNAPVASLRHQSMVIIQTKPEDRYSGSPGSSQSAVDATKMQPQMINSVQRQRNTKTAVLKKRQNVEEVKKRHERTAETVATQGVSWRDRLAEIEFRAIERPDGLLACSLCHETYRTKTLVTRHAVSHLEDPKPFSCPTCNKRFSRCDTLHRHTKRKACKIELPRTMARRPA